MSSKEKPKRSIASIILIIICIGIIAYALFYLWDWWYQRHKQEVNYEHLRISSSRDVQKLHKENPDFVGWLTVPGTKIDYPVMQTSKKNPEYYLRRDFKGNYSIPGTPFVSAYTNMNKDFDWLIYGHNIPTGTMFHTLLRYDNKSFYEKHKTFTFDTWKYGKHTYEIISAGRTSTHEPFKYWYYCNKSSEKDYNKYTQGISRYISAYKTRAKAKYKEQLVTLSTCAYHTENGRFVVVGKVID